MRSGTRGQWRGPKVWALARSQMKHLFSLVKFPLVGFVAASSRNIASCLALRPGGLNLLL
jgi:hypothetical protein